MKKAIIILAVIIGWGILGQAGLVPSLPLFDTLLHWFTLLAQG